MRDGKQDWTPSALAANANMFLDDFLLFDVAKPITDTSHLEIEKSTLNGKAYQTGGGRTVDADVIDVLLTWMVNRDREPLRRRDDEGHQAWHEELSILRYAQHRTAKRCRPHRPQRRSGQGLGTDRTLRRELASFDRQYQADRRWHRSIARHRNDRRQADHRAS